MRWLRRSVTALGLVAIVASGWWLREVTSDEQQLADQESARRAAVEQAQVAVGVMLSYDHAELEDDLTASAAAVTDDFLPQWTRLQEGLIGPATKHDRLTTTASVDRAAVVTATGRRIEVLVFLTQTTREGDQRPEIAHTRAVVTMERDGDEWLVDDLRAT